MVTKAKFSAFLCLFCSVSVLSADLPSLQELQHQMNQWQHKAVYDQLKPLEYEFAGRADYDYLYGLAALRQGFADEASWALERLVLTDPENLRGKLALATAYFEMGRLNTAERLVKEVQATLPTGSVKASADKLSQKIAKAKAPKPLSLDTHFKLSLGYDSNVSSAPGFRFDPADPAGEETPSVFSEITAAQQLTYQLNPAWKLNAGYQLKDSRPYSESDYIRQNLGIKAGIGYMASEWTVSVAPGYSKGWKDGKGELAETSFDLSSSFRLDSQQALLAFMNRSSLTYDQTSAADGDFTLLGGGWVGSPSNQWLPVTWVATGYLLVSDQKDNPTGDMTLIGANLQGSLSTNKMGRLQGRLGLSHRTYDCAASHNACDSGRRDIQAIFGLSSQYEIKPRWQLEPMVSYTTQLSNDDNYEYNRLIMQVSVRYDLDSWKR